MDAVHGYFQVPLDMRGSFLTTFLIPWGHCRYGGAPMGLSSSSDEFNGRGDKAVVGLSAWLLKIVDDMLGQDVTSAWPWWNSETLRGPMVSPLQWLSSEDGSGKSCPLSLPVRSLCCLDVMSDQNQSKCHGNDCCYLLKRGENFENYLQKSQIQTLAPEWTRRYWHGCLCLVSWFASGFTLSMSSEPAKYWIFLTNWGLTLALITYTLQFGLTLYYQGQHKAKRLNKRIKTLWFFLNTNAAVSHLITMFYWFFIFPNLPKATDPAQLALGASPQDINLNWFQIGSVWMDRWLGHGLLPTLVWVDLLLFSARPWRFRQFWNPMLFGAAWVLFSLVYFICGGTGYAKHVDPQDEKSVANAGSHFIYKMVDWKQPEQTSWIVAIIGILVGVSHWALCAIAWLLKRYIWKHAPISDVNLDSQSNPDEADISLMPQSTENAPKIVVTSV
eukprot:maker-scaffold71_size417697-snap-gene-2.11 protein:Tk11805 transcript:maker-scaffold71_size417697-snap-gene-2.11-mRNA-1 annotation:"protein rolling stone-like"